MLSPMLWSMIRKSMPSHLMRADSFRIKL